MSKVLWKIHYWPFFKNFSQKVNNPKWSLDDLWPHIRWCLMCNSMQGSFETNSHGNTSKYVDTVTIFQKLNQKVNDPKMTFDPTSVEVTCVTLLKDHCIKVPWKYIKVCGYSDQFLQNTTYIIQTDGHTYYVQNEWSHSLFLIKVQARHKVQDQKYSPNCSEISGPNASKMRIWYTLSNTPLPDFCHPSYYTLEWQVFRDSENTEKSQKLNTKRKTHTYTPHPPTHTKCGKHLFCDPKTISNKVVVFKIF